MPEPETSLDDLRREIDRIDAEIHALLIERTVVVEGIARAKDRETGTSGGNGQRRAFRPGREALVLRELVGRHRGAFPVTSLVRIWREIMSGMVRIQANFIVAACRAEGAVGQEIWDAARDHFGLGATYRAFPRPGQVIAAVRDGSATVGVLPAPSGGEERPWWSALLFEREGGPHVVGRLPFLETDSEARPDARQYVIAAFPPEPSGDDVSLIALEANRDASTSMIRSTLADAGIEAARWIEAPGDAGARLVLVETPGFVQADDGRLRSLAGLARGWLGVVRVLGSCANPIVVAPAVVARQSVA